MPILLFVVRSECHHPNSLPFAQGITTGTIIQSSVAPTLDIMRLYSREQRYVMISAFGKRYHCTPSQQTLWSHPKIPNQNPVIGCDSSQVYHCIVSRLVLNYVSEPWLGIFVVDTLPAAGPPRSFRKTDSRSVLHPRLDIPINLDIQARGPCFPPG